MKELFKIFDRLCYSHSAGNVFDDLLTITLSQFVPFGLMEEEHRQAVNRLEKGELISDFVSTLIKDYESAVSERGWFDPLGDLYMEITGHYKTSGLGQFFTPQHLCSLMAQMQIGEGIENKRIADLACGSGRTLLAVKAIAPNNYFFGEDIDLICCKMSSINFAVHGCIGEIVNHDTLAGPKEMRRGWKIANIGLPIPAILPLRKEESFICSGVNWFDNHIKPEEKKESIIQLSLFEEVKA